MDDYGYISAQRQYDSQIPKRYDDKPVLKCSYCKEDICIGEEYFEIVGRIYCSECGEVKTLYAENFEDEVFL